MIYKAHIKYKQIVSLHVEERFINTIEFVFFVLDFFVSSFMDDHAFLYLRSSYRNIKDGMKLKE